MLNIGRGHIYKAISKQGDKREILGWITKGRAKKIFKDQNIFFSESDALCPYCKWHINHDKDIKLL